jgi:hypothetical protein
MSLAPRERKVLTVMLASGILAFIAFGALVFQLNLRVAYWHLAHCGADASTNCTAAALEIGYWWVPFLLVVLSTAVAARRLYEGLTRSD